MAKLPYSHLRYIEDVILDALPEVTGERDAAVHRDWHNGQPIRRIASEYDLREVAVRRIIKNVEDLILTWLTPERMRALLPSNQLLQKGTPVDALQLSTRSHNVLFELGVNTVEDLCNLSSKQIYIARNSGIKTVVEIQNAIFKYKSSL